MLHYFGLALWLGGVAVLRPVPSDLAWGRLLLALAALVFVPCASQWRFGRQRLVFLAGVSFAVGVMLPANWISVLLVLPWLLTSATLAVRSLIESRRAHSWPDVGIEGAWWFLPVGAAWALFDRLELRPLGFEPVIVLLTAIHFHHAGFVLPLLAGRVLKATGAGRISVWGVVLAVPALAAGITATQLGAPKWIEGAAAVAVVLAAASVGLAHLRLAPFAPSWRRAGFLCAGSSLLVGMAFAAFYGLRFFLAVDWLDIPTMRSWHGSINGLGFALVGMLAWDGWTPPSSDGPRLSIVAPTPKIDQSSRTA